LGHAGVGVCGLLRQADRVRLECTSASHAGAVVTQTSEIVNMLSYLVRVSPS
jgi:hypothetical protein